REREPSQIGSTPLGTRAQSLLQENIAEISFLLMSAEHRFFQPHVSVLCPLSIKLESDVVTLMAKGCSTTCTTSSKGIQHPTAGNSDRLENIVADILAHLNTEHSIACSRSIVDPDVLFALLD